MIDQNALPFEFRIYEAKTFGETCHAIETMITRGAGAIGAAAGFAMAQVFMESITDLGKEELYLEKIEAGRKRIENTRPTARNLFDTTERVFNAGIIKSGDAFIAAESLAEKNVEDALKIAEFGKLLLKDESRILTHCNAGWLGFVDWGSALAPIYLATREGKKIFVYVDETRPRSQGARLTAWELKNEGIEHLIVADSAGAYLMSNGLVDLVIVGADRIAQNGDAANKIGTFEKAIIAKEFGIPFYVAAPLSTFDLSIPDGSFIRIEERSQEEIQYQSGPDEEGILRKVRIASPGSPAFNPAFDVTPADFITGIITEKGIIKPSVNTIRRIME